MTNLRESTLAVILILTFFIGAAFLFIKTSNPVEGAGFQMTNIGGTATSSAVVSVTTSTRIAATTTNPINPSASFTRMYTVICNPTTNPVAILMDGDKPENATTVGVDAWIAAAAGYNACYELTDRNQYNGSIQASSTSQAAVPVSVVQYVQ